MIVVYTILIVIFLALWAYCRVCYFALREPTDNFWRFIRRSLPLGLMGLVLTLDVTIKAFAGFKLYQLSLTVYAIGKILWQLY